VLVPQEAEELLKFYHKQSEQVPEKCITGLPISRGVPEVILTPEICMPIPEETFTPKERPSSSTEMIGQHAHLPDNKNVLLHG